MQAQRFHLNKRPFGWDNLIKFLSHPAAHTTASQSFYQQPTASLRFSPASAVKSVSSMGKHGPMLLGGHRGMGENLATTSPDGKTGVYPAFRENTIHSFQQAAKCGVGFVEFDVQVTRDNVPVIWHDDDVVHGPADRPSKPQVKDLTLAELRELCGSGGAGQVGSAPDAASGAEQAAPVDGAEAAGSSPGRASTAGDSRTGAGEASSASPRGLLRRFRDRDTRQFSSSYEKWTCEQDDGIPTLEAVFSALPPEVGFDIEVKMTTGDDVVHTPADEVERMLGAILPVVRRCAAAAVAAAGPGGAPAGAPSPAGGSPPLSPLPTAHLAPGAEAANPPPPQQPQQSAQQPQQRRIMFSSFDPDVCVELKKRQADHPVYYLSGCGLYSHADARRTSIPAALSFAAEAGMRGIVVPASVLLKNMDMVDSANRSHLELMTYGLENNDLDCLKKQADAGVKAAIVDEVAGVTAALNTQDGDAAAGAAPAAPPASA